MYKSKVYDLLDAGRLVIRMHLGGYNSLFVAMDLYCIVNTIAGLDSVTRLVNCGFTATANRVDPLRFRVIGERHLGETNLLLEDWRVKVASTWPYYWSEGQIVCSVIHEEKENEVVPHASIQALPQYARCIDQLNLFVANAREETPEVEAARHILLKLRTIYDGIIKTWSQCVTVI